MKNTLVLISFLFLASVASSQVSKTDSAQIRSTIMGFYNWYLKNHSRINSFELYKGVKSSDSPPYKINWSEVNRYLAYIRSSVPWLGEAYIANQKKFFQDCDSVFRADPEGEIPFGFDFDWYTNSQEDPGWLVDELKQARAWVTTVNGNDATVDVLGQYNDNGNMVETVILCYAMKKEKGKWKIARISCPYSKY